MKHIFRKIRSSCLNSGYAESRFLRRVESHKAVEGSFRALSCSLCGHHSMGDLTMARIFCNTFGSGYMRAFTNGD